MKNGIEEMDSNIRSVLGDLGISEWAFNLVHHYGFIDGWNSAIAAVKQTSAERIKKESAFNKRAEYPTMFECSSCGWECDDTLPGDTEEYNYCPNCGRKIVRKDDENDK